MSLPFQVILHTLAGWLFLKHSVSHVCLFKNSSGKPQPIELSAVQTPWPTSWCFRGSVPLQPYLLLPGTCLVLRSGGPTPIPPLEPCFSCPPASALAVESLPFKATEMPPLSWRVKTTSQLHVFPPSCPLVALSLSERQDSLLFSFLDTSLVTHSWAQAHQGDCLISYSCWTQYSFIYFNWMLITLQYYSGFAIHWHVSATGIHVFPILNLPPHPIPQGHPSAPSPEHPVSCVEPGLAICFTYDNTRVSVLFSQIIPPSPSPTESRSLSVHLCLFCCLAYRVIVTVFLNSVYMC